MNPFDHATTKVELDKRGLTSRADTGGALTSISRTDGVTRNVFCTYAA